MKIKEIINLVEGEVLSGSYEADINEIKQNSSQILKGDTFIAIKGENLDGHTFLDDAIKNGASVCIVSNNKFTSDKATILLVPDTEKALEILTKYKLSQMDMLKIGITGSVGKTSTKELVSEVVGEKFKVFKTYKNFNTQRGIMLSLSNVDLDVKVGVFEMGMSERNTISTISKMIVPDIGVITNIGSSHIGRLGSKEEILKAKFEILDGIKKGGILLLNADDKMLMQYNKYFSEKIAEKEITIVTYGIDNTADILAKNIQRNEEGTNFTVVMGDYKGKFVSNTFGKHSIYNCLVAIYISKMLSIPDKNIKEALLRTKVTERRMEKFVTISNMLVFDDSYNSSYESVAAAVDVITNKKYYGRKIAVLGDILELGEFAEEYHRKIGKLLIDKNFDVVITAGENSKYINEEILKSLKDNQKMEIYHFESTEEIIENIDKLLQVDDVILIKASNGMNFNKIAEHLRKQEVDLKDLK